MLSTDQVAQFNRAVYAKAVAAGAGIAAAASTPYDIDEYDGDTIDSDLIFDLIDEELTELKAAYAAEDKDAVLKEICDLMYVILRAAYLWKMDDVLSPAFNRVHDNNMLKIEYGTFRGDGKLIKSPDHPKVNLKDLTY